MRATMSAPMLGCSRSSTHSSSSSGPGFESTAPATAIVPTSCSRPARRRSPCRLSGRPSSRPTSSASSATLHLVLVRHALAHGGGAGQRGCDAHGLARLVVAGLEPAVLDVRPARAARASPWRARPRPCAAARRPSCPGARARRRPRPSRVPRGRPSAAAPASGSRRSRRRCGAAPRRRADRARARRSGRRRRARSCRRCARCARAGPRARAGRQSPTAWPRRSLSSRRRSTSSSTSAGLVCSRCERASSRRATSSRWWRLKSPVVGSTRERRSASSRASCRPMRARSRSVTSLITAS